MCLEWSNREKHSDQGILFMSNMISSNVKNKIGSKFKNKVTEQKRLEQTMVVNCTAHQGHGCP